MALVKVLLPSETDLLSLAPPTLETETRIIIFSEFAPVAQLAGFSSTVLLTYLTLITLVDGVEFVTLSDVFCNQYIVVPGII